MNEIKVFEMFAGYGGAIFSLKNLKIKHKVVGFSEIEKDAIKCYEHNHENVKNYGDAFKIDEKELPNFDLLTGGFPCSPKGTMVKTINGYKRIEDISENDYVLTHKNKFEKVLVTMKKISNHINVIKSQGCYNLRLTDEHPLYVIRDNKLQWVETKDLTTNDYITYNINNISKNKHNLSKNECWLIGRYLADGSIEYDRNRIYFSIGSHKRKQFEEKIKNYKYYVCHEKRNCQEFYLNDERLLNILKLCNNGSLNKEIPLDIINLPKDLLNEVWEGYFSGDGHYDTKVNRYMFSTVSEKMFLGLQDIIIKLFNKIPSCNIRIDNRSDNYNDSYNGQFYKTQRKSFVFEDKLCVKIDEINRFEKEIEVFNFEVDKDNSYTLNNVIVHNCQTFSAIGKKRGFEDTKGTLIFEILRIAKFKQPKYMLLENVEGLLQHDKGNTFEIILKAINDVGYNVKVDLLNSKDYKIPHNRSRLWFVCIRKDLDIDFKFPMIDKNICIKAKTLIEDKVDKKYYLTKNKINYLVERTKKNIRLNNGFIFKPKKINDNTIISCLTTNYGSITTDFYINLDNNIDFDKFYNYIEIGNIKRLKDKIEINNSKVQCQLDNNEKRARLDISLYDNIPKLDELKLCKVRKLTPRECFRFMGFVNDEIKFPDISEGSLYKLAGNGWEIQVVSYVLNRLFGNVNKDYIVYDNKPINKNIISIQNKINTNKLDAWI